MKSISLLAAVLLLGATFCLAEDPKGGQVLAGAQAAAKKEKEEKKTPVTPPKPSSEILGHKVYYGGYFTDFVRSESKRTLLNLKAPIDPPKDLENVVFYPGTEKVQGIVLFSIKF